MFDEVDGEGIDEQTFKQTIANTSDKLKNTRIYLFMLSFCDDQRFEELIDDVELIAAELLSPGIGTTERLKKKIKTL